MSFLSGVDKRQEVNTNASMTVYVERDVNNFDFEKYNHLRIRLFLFGNTIIFCLASFYWIFYSTSLNSIISSLILNDLKPTICKMFSDQSIEIGEKKGKSSVNTCFLRTIFLYKRNGSMLPRQTIIFCSLLNSCCFIHYFFTIFTILSPFTFKCYQYMPSVDQYK